MVTLYVMIGNIGSGKSTWAREKVKSTPRTIIVNRDALRTMVGGGEYIFDKEMEPFIKHASRGVIEEALLEEYNVIVDETNLTKAHRYELIQIVDWVVGSDVRIVFVYCPENKRNIQFRSNNLRGYTPEYWQEVYDHMAEIIEPPSEDEGADEIKIHTIPEEIKNEL